MSDRTFELFDEYAAAYARGERPEAEAYLDRAGSERQHLARLLEGFLRRAPVQEPTEDDRRLLGLLLTDEPPLLALRVERGVRVDDVVGVIVERLGLDPSGAAKVKRYYQQLEGGLLDPRGLSRRLRGVIVDTLGAGADAAMAWTAEPAPASAFLRRAEYLESSPAAAAPTAETEDQIDRLFTGGD